MLTINTNLSSLIAQQNLKQSTNKLNTAIERMTTGFKINSAKDNAANYSISTNMTTKIGAYQVAEDNAAMGLDLVGTAEGTLSQIQDKLARLRALAEQAANGTYGEQSLNAINTEANAIVDEIERIYSTAEYNGRSLLKEDFTTVDIIHTETVQEEVISIDGTETSLFIKDIDRRITDDMETFASVDVDRALTEGTYSISTPEELSKLATMTNNGLIGADTEFVLANNIDLSGYASWTPIGSVNKSFKATFDGNGYVVQGLKITGSEDYRGLFGAVRDGGKIMNLGIEDAVVSGNNTVGILAGFVQYSSIENCYTEGIVSGGPQTGGVVGNLYNSTLNYCNSSSTVTSWGNDVGGISGLSVASTISNSSFRGAFKETSSSYYIYSGGISGQILTNSVIENCYVELLNTSTISSGGGVFCGIGSNDSVLRNSYYDSGLSSYSLSSGVATNNLSSVTTAPQEFLPDAIITNYRTDIIDKLITTVETVISDRNPVNIELQVGVNNSPSSKIDFITSLALVDIDDFRGLGIDNLDYISKIDNVLAVVSQKSIELGAVSNRLESVLDEIQIQHDNLVSSRSTLRDADIAEVSAEYIQQQILQQASATLLATANQSPSIALQLI